MEFKLTEPNKQYSNAELLQDLKRTAKALGLDSISQREYNEHGNFSYQTQKKRFGSWKKAIEKAGLKQSKRSWGGNLSETRIPENLLLSDMNDVANTLNKKNITISEYDKNGKFGSSAICKRFNGWNNAKKKAGLEVGRVYNSSDEDYFENIASVWGYFGRQPKYQEMTAPISQLHISSYERKFGTWRDALEKFVEYMNSKDDKDSKEESLQDIEFIPAEIIKIKTVKHNRPKVKKRTNRIANLRQRFRVMKRDGFKCVLCGDSPAKNPTCELHIDHITPWSHGGETIEENLRTLCSSCNLGRSNKE